MPFNARTNKLLTEMADVDVERGLREEIQYTTLGFRDPPFLVIAPPDEDPTIMFNRDGLSPDEETGNSEWSIDDAVSLLAMLFAAVKEAQQIGDNREIEKTRADDEKNNEREDLTLTAERDETTEGAKGERKRKTAKGQN